MARRTLLTAIVILALAAPSLAQRPLDATDAVEFDRAAAAHLLRRAGFGGSPADIDRLVALGRDKAVASLIDYDQVSDDLKAYPHLEPRKNLPRDMMQKLDLDGRRELNSYLQRNDYQQMAAVREWWYYRMAATARPLQEKMTLFWHGHFTSGFREVRTWEFMLAQNELFRENALGRFEPILQAVSRDAAMLRYLDNGRNVKAKPNENYARELMELFTMGEGNYSEDDVKAAARAFTGWTTDRNGKFTIRRGTHDTGSKTFLGKSGNFDGDDIIRIILDQPATSRYMARSLWEFFAYPDPEPEIVEALAAVLRSSKYDFRVAMRALLRSDAFYSDRARGALIKSPVELVVGSARMLEVDAGNPRMLYVAAQRMGQDLFQPPNVKGWDGGRTWITTSTLFNRYNYAAWLLNGYGQRPKPGQKADDAMEGDGMMMMAGGDRGMEKKLDEILKPLGDQAEAAKVMFLQEIRPVPRFGVYHEPYDPAGVLKQHDLATADKLVDHYVDRLLLQPLPADRRTALVSAVTDDGKRTFDPKSRTAVMQVRGLVYLIMSMPEYQVN